MTEQGTLIIVTVGDTNNMLIVATSNAVKIPYIKLPHSTNMKKTKYKRKRAEVLIVIFNEALDRQATICDKSKHQIRDRSQLHSADCNHINAQ
jgi:hypothetical protein